MSFTQMLIIDDDIQSIKRYTRLFSPNFLCIGADNGEDGIKLFEQEKPSIVLCDVKMKGGISGFDVCRHVKNATPDVIFIFISIYQNSNNRIRGYELRADDYIHKMMDEKETYLKVLNLYYTKNNIPAKLPDYCASNHTVDDVFEDRVRAVMVEYYSKPLHDRDIDKISLKYISEKLASSERTIQRNFSNKTACKFVYFHNLVRMEMACQHLTEDTHFSISEIAHLLCFSSPSNFSKEFKAKFSITPSKYRSNHLLN